MLFRVLVATVVPKLYKYQRPSRFRKLATYPDIVSLFYQYEGKAALSLSHTHPYLTVHE
jgi:hypothetical protein